MNYSQQYYNNLIDAADRSWEAYKKTNDEFFKGQYEAYEFAATLFMGTSVLNNTFIKTRKTKKQLEREPELIERD